MLLLVHFYFVVLTLLEHDMSITPLCSDSCCFAFFFSPIPITVQLMWLHKLDSLKNAMLSIAYLFPEVSQLDFSEYQSEDDTSDS